MNKVTEWSYDIPTESGTYLVCYGDIETPANLSLNSFYHAADGKLIDKDFDLVSEVYSKSYKFAKLSFK